MKNIKLLCLCLLIFSSCTPTAHEFASSNVTTQELQQHIRYLASDELRGRKAGEEGNRLAAQYIAEKFRQCGLQPIGDHGSYFQDFAFISSTKEGEKNKLSIIANGALLHYSINDEYKPLSFSTDTSVNAPLVFTGYGIAAAESLHYDDYANMDVRNKIVAVLRYSPDGIGVNKFSEYSSLMVKTFTARDKGATGIIFLTAPPDSEGAELTSLKAPTLSNSGIAATGMKWKPFDSLCHLFGKDLRIIQHDIDSTKKTASFEFSNTTISMQTQIVKVHSQSANIAGYLPGRDSLLKDEILIIGAHMDHLGMGGEGSGSLKPDTVAVHHGADDNASGTAGLIELAEYFAAQRNLLNRSILFLSFSGEELGLLGSDYYVKHPMFPLDRTIAMLNMDMIGRMKDSTLVVEGMGTSPHWEELAKKENLDSLHLKLKPDGLGPSDHASFYAKSIPVMFFFTNIHSDYHRPSDTWDKINYFGEQKVVQYVARIATDIANDSIKPSFTKYITSSNTSPSGDRSGVRVVFGIVPDFAEDAPGLRISGTRPGSPAEKAGLKENDVIIKFGGKDMKNIYDLMYLLGQHRPNDVVVVVVKRGNEELSLTATLEAKK